MVGCRLELLACGDNSTGGLVGICGMGVIGEKDCSCKGCLLGECGEGLLEGRVVGCALGSSVGCTLGLTVGGDTGKDVGWVDG